MKKNSNRIEMVIFITISVLIFIPFLMSGMSTDNKEEDYIHTPRGGCEIVDIPSHRLSKDCN